jgi:REP element-mobilizing transposase RayT
MDEPGALHHVMIRGIDGRAIFEGDASREDFTHHLGLLVGELRFLVLAWCLLDNHAHFVLRSGAKPLSLLMARLTSRHAQRLNRSVERVGHLFQGRYKAARVRSESWLARDIAYVLGNPVRHGLLTIGQLASYPYSGYGSLLGTQPPRSFESPVEVASALGVERHRIETVVADGALEVGTRAAALEPDQKRELQLLIRECCRRYGISEEALRAPSPETRGAQAEICKMAGVSLDLPMTEIAREIGAPAWTARRLRPRVFIGA